MSAFLMDFPRFCYEVDSLFSFHMFACTESRHVPFIRLFAVYNVDVDAFPEQELRPVRKIACPVCTFLNSSDRVVCDICETRLRPSEGKLLGFFFVFVFCVVFLLRL
jgi:hypothetical protein